MALSDYTEDARSLLLDQSAVFTPARQLTRWINEARRDCAKLTGCVRRHISGQSAFGATAQPGGIIPGAMQPGALPSALPAANNPLAALSTAQNTLATITGVERYPYQGFFNPFLQAQHAGCKGVIDTISCAVQWGGNFRPEMTYMTWDDLQAYCRAYSNQTTAYPAVWSIYNDGEYGEIWLFPVPSQPNEIELDALCMPSDIYSDDDFDAIPPEMRSSIKWLAASIAFDASQRYAQADKMRERFATSVGLSSVARDTGKSNAYGGYGF